MKTKEVDYEIKWYHLLPLMLIVAIVPLIVYLKVVPLTGASFDFWKGTKDNLDFFSYYKGIWLVIAASLALCIYVVRLFQVGSLQLKKEMNIYYIAASLYFLFITASTFFSEYKEIAINGFPDHYEGFYILTTYIVIFLITTIWVSNEKHIKILLGSLIAGASVLGTIGLFQYLGYDIWQSNLGKYLMLPNQYQTMASSLQFQFTKHTIYSTLYHPDYVGSYMAMLFPLAFSMFVLTKNKQLKIPMLFFTILMVTNWLGSNSRAGMVGGILAIIVFLISINKIILKYWKYFGVGLIFATVIFFGLNQVSHGYLGSRVNSLFVDAKAVLGLTEKSQDTSTVIPLKDVKINGNQASIVTATETLNITLNNDLLIFQDGNANKIESSYDNKNGKMILRDSRYAAYNLLAGKMGDKTFLKVEKGDIKLTFDLERSGITLVDNKGKVVDLKPVETWGFKGHERLGSSRGYIWSRSIPLLKDTLLLGHGPDTFAAYFPQNDIKGKMYAYYGDMWQLVDKPHDLYLQIALNTGVISLLAFLILIGSYSIKSLKLYFGNNYEDFLSQVGVSVFVAIVGYLGAAFFNDSVVSVAPVFWILLGLGISINYIVSNQGVIKNITSKP